MSKSNDSEAIRGRMDLCEVLLENARNRLANTIIMRSDAYSTLSSSAKTAFNSILEPTMSKPTAGLGWRDIFISIESPLLSDKRPAARIVKARCEAIGNQAAAKPMAPTMTSRAGDDEDVTYLYTVDSSSSGRIVPEIDLSQESETASSSRESITKTNLKKPAASKGQKRKSTGNASPRKRSNDGVVLQCQNCKKNVSLTANGANMFLASCGHFSCRTCFPAVSTSTRCSCGKEVLVLRKTTRFPLERVAITNDRKPVSPRGQKRKLEEVWSPRKRSNNEVLLRCQNCRFNFSLTANGTSMFLASCGHLFCETCSPVVSTTECSCGEKVHELRKLYR